MAIHKDYPGLKVEIVVNDTALPEHEDPELECRSNEVIRYVEAEAGAEFAIRCHFDETFPRDRDVSEDIYIDGQVIVKQFEKKADIGLNSPYHIRDLERRVRGRYMKQSFCFGELITSKIFPCRCRCQTPLTTNPSGRGSTRPSHKRIRKGQAAWRDHV